MDTRNFVRLVGNLGTDPKVTETRGGKVALWHSLMIG